MVRTHRQNREILGVDYKIQSRSMTSFFRKTRGRWKVEESITANGFAFLSAVILELRMSPKLC